MVTRSAGPHHRTNDRPRLAHDTGAKLVKAIANYDVNKALDPNLDFEFTVEPAPES